MTVRPKSLDINGEQSSWWCDRCEVPVLFDHVCCEHSWRIEGDDETEPIHAECEECGVWQPDPLEEAG